MAELAPIPHRHWPTPGEILKQIAESARGTAKWVGHHKRGALLFGTILTGTGGAIIYAVNPAFNQTVNSLPTEAAAWWNSMLRGSGSGSSVVIPETATATPKPIPTETKLTPTIEAQKPKPLPDVINNQTVNFIQPSPGVVGTLIDEAQAKGERKLPLPDLVKNNSNISIKEITDNSGRYKSLAIVSSETGVRTYSLPALKAGVVTELNVSKPGHSSSARSVGIKTEDGNTHGYFVPDNASSDLILGSYVNAGQTVITFIYVPKSLQVDNWISGLQSQTKGAPTDTIATIEGGSRGLGTNDILTLQDSVVVVGPQGKG